MNSIKLGRAVVSTDDNGLIIEGDNNTQIRIDAEGIYELFDFLRSSALNRFNRRRHFRIPLTAASGLAITLHVHGVGYRVTPVNVSFGGFLAKVGKTAFEGLIADKSVGVTLRFEDAVLKLTATARRFDDDLCGFEFDDAGNAEVNTIVMELQRRWLARRTSPRD